VPDYRVKNVLFNSAEFPVYYNIDSSFISDSTLAAKPLKKIFIIDKLSFDSVQKSVPSPYKAPTKMLSPYE
jgi:hypothetical protein